MTDLVTRPEADSDRTDAAAQETTESTYAWAPAEPPARKNRSALWIGLPAGATAVALVAASLVLIAPGASVAGVEVGGMTQGAAADAIAARLAATELVVEGPAGSVTVTGAQLGASVDASAAAAAAFETNPMWNPSTWFPGSVQAPVSIDEETATEALRGVAPDLFVDPVDASIAFDQAAASYVVADAVPGQGVDLAAVRDALQGAFDSGSTSAAFDAEIVPVEAALTTDEAAATVANLNGVLDTVGFYIGEERVVPVDRGAAASWLSVAPDGAGGFAVTADAAAIQPVVDGLAGVVNREAVNATVITDSAGSVLSTLTAGVSGRALESTDGIAQSFADQLAQGDGSFELAVAETPFTTATLQRRIEVNLSSQRTTLWENGQVVQSWASSSGLPTSPTQTGNYRIGWKTSLQDMGCFEGAPYCTENVPWVAYFNGDQAFHGAYWHNNFGNVMSHGCVNLPVSAAKFLYDWAPKGTEVNLHY
jgi:lipoprotein-anchoring transpeptidase ErfK/SrfK